MHSIKLSHLTARFDLWKVYFREDIWFSHSVRSDSRHLNKFFISVVTKRNIVLLLSLKLFLVHRVPHGNSVRKLFGVVALEADLIWSNGLELIDLSVCVEESPEESDSVNTNKDRSLDSLRGFLVLIRETDTKLPNFKYNSS